MKMLTPRDEKDLVGAIEQSIQLTHSGLSPNDAIIKVASERKYGPEKISRMVEAFNKSKSVHVFKSAAQEDRAKPFPIADTATILSSIFSSSQKKASSYFSLPAKNSITDFSMFSEKESVHRLVDFLKTAADGDDLSINQESADSRDKGIKETCVRLSKQAAQENRFLREKIANDLHMKVQFHKLSFDNALDKLCEHIAPLSPRGLRKVGQYIFNGYPSSGENLLNLISNKARVSFPKFTKTANAVCFPTQEPYISLNNLYKSAEDMAKAEVTLSLFEKKASEFKSNLAANTLANFLANLKGSESSVSNAASQAFSSSGGNLELSSSTANKLKEIEAKKVFLDLALYHKDLKHYDHKSLVDAFNTAISIAPSSIDNPSVLSNLMIKNIQSSGIKDPFEIAQELAIDKSLREAGYLQDLEDREAKDRAEAKKLKDSPLSTAPLPELGLDYLFKATKKRISQEGGKERKKNDRPSPSKPKY